MGSRWAVVFGSVAALGITSICYGQSEAKIATSSGFQGNWTYSYGCSSSDPARVKTCAGGRKDEFSLIGLKQSGGKMCGDHLVTAHFGAKVDQSSFDPVHPTIVGTITGAVANVEFRSGRSGAVGHATLTRVGETIEWRVTKALDSDEDYFPSHAVLTQDARRLPNKVAGKCVIQ